MKAIDFTKLGRLNKAIQRSHTSPDQMKSYAPAYFTELRRYIPSVMAAIV